MFCLGCTPTACFFTWPFSNTIKVGTLMTPYFWAMSGLWSISSLYTVAFPACSPAISSMVVLGARLPASCEVATDGWRAYNDWALGGRPHEVRGSRELEMVNSLHSRLKSFVGRFNGVSNRRLQRYLDWFCWREQFRSSARDRRELLYGHEANGRYVCTRQLTHLEARPFMSCVNRWTIGERHGYMSMVV